MLDRLASGGLFPVVMVLGLAFGYARVFDAKRPIYIGITAIALLIVIGSQFMAQTSVFRMAIHEDLMFIGHGLLWSLPFLAYGAVIYFIRRKTREREKSNGSDRA